MKKFNSLLKKIVIIIIIIYGVITFANQQKILNTYATNSENLDEQISEATKRQEKLYDVKNNVSSSEYIEQVAREKLDMYLPNERVYIDCSN